jgi:hypothetical protein
MNYQISTITIYFVMRQIQIIMIINQQLKTQINKNKAKELMVKFLVIIREHNQTL